MSLLTMERTVDERLQKGIDYKIQGLYEEAEREIRAVVDDDPMDSRAHCEMGLVLCFTGMFDESLDALRKAVELAPDSVDFRNHLGLTYCMLGMYDEGRVEFELVLEQDPENAVALRQMEFFQ